MFRNVLSVIVGLILCFILILVGEQIISTHLITMPTALDMKNPEIIKTFIATAPPSFHLFILINYAIATLIGCFFCSIIASSKKITKAVTIGGILTGVGILNMVSVGHPAWVIICGVFAFLPFAYFGGLIGAKLSSPKK